jgi:hypothetical protein
VSTAKNRKSLLVHDIILIEFDFSQMRALVLNLLKIESCLNSLGFILIDLVFLQGIQICDQNRHASLGAQPTKNRILGDIIRKKVQRSLNASRINTARSESEFGAYHNLPKMVSSCMSLEKMSSGLESYKDLYYML